MPKKSKWKQQYQKERRRIQNFINRAENRGYYFEFDMPKPASEKKRITKADVERLRKMNAAYLYQRATYTRAVDPSTGVPLTGRQGREFERSEAAKKGAQTKRKRGSSTLPQDKYVDIVLLTFEAKLSNYIRGTGWDNLIETVQQALQNAIATKGRRAVAEHLEQHPEYIEQLEQAMYYKYYQPAAAAAQKIVTDLLGIPLSLEVQKSFGEHLESVEDWEEPD